MKHRIGSGTLTREDVPRIRNVPVLTRDGEEIGHVGDVYYEELSGRVACVGVPADRIGLRKVMVPAGGAQLTEVGLRLPLTRDQLRDYGDANLGPDVDEERWQEELAHYGGLGVPALTPDQPPGAAPLRLRRWDERDLWF
jgi:PRC-barrel domain